MGKGPRGSAKNDDGDDVISICPTHPAGPRSLAKTFGHRPTSGLRSCEDLPLEGGTVEKNAPIGTPYR